MLMTLVLRRDVIRGLAVLRYASIVITFRGLRVGIIKAPGKEPHERKENGTGESWPTISRPSPAVSFHEKSIKQTDEAITRLEVKEK